MLDAGIQLHVFKIWNYRVSAKLGLCQITAVSDRSGALQPRSAVTTSALWTEKGSRKTRAEPGARKSDWKFIQKTEQKPHRGHAFQTMVEKGLNMERVLSLSYLVMEAQVWAGVGKEARAKAVHPTTDHLGSVWRKTHKGERGSKGLNT